MKIFILFLALCVTIPIYTQENISMDETNKTIQDIQTRYIPDKRVAVFNYTVIQEEGKTIITGETDLPSLKNEVEQKFSGSSYITRIELLPSKELSSNIFGVINLSVANIRTKPDHGAEMATQALLGQPVKILQKKRGWYLVQTPDKYIAWADDDGVEVMNEKEMMIWKSFNKVIYTNAFGFAYSEMDINSVPVSDLVQGNILKKVSVEGDFVKVEFPDKRSAFIPASEVKDFDNWISDLSPSKESILSSAFNLMGTPYLWGGTSCKGVDCSGFTKTVYYMNGFILPRDASQQVAAGDVVDISKGFGNLQPGDLLFFGSKATDTTKERVSHVGIYIGDNDFIHSSGRVRINSLDKSKENFSAYRFNTLLRAKRILGADKREYISEVKDLFRIIGMQP